MFTSTIVTPVLTIVHFYTFQKELAEAHCVNKEKPELNCNGHCYLQKELQVQNLNLETENEERTLNFNAFWANAFNQVENINIPYGQYKKMGVIPYSNLYDYIDFIQILDPPETLI